MSNYVIFYTQRKSFAKKKFSMGDFLWEGKVPIRSFIGKKNLIGSAINEMFRYRKTSCYFYKRTDSWLKAVVDPNYKTNRLQE